MSNNEKKECQYYAKYYENKAKYLKSQLNNLRSRQQTTVNNRIINNKTE
jgi:hypothetical protein